MSDLSERLVGLGLSQYCEILTNEGFDTWETLLDITESDLSHLDVKLGHRRKLQRAIAEYRGQSAERPLPLALARTASIEALYRSDESATENKGKQRQPPAANTAGAGANTATGTGTKRKYRRHPKADENAPERPPSAYVIFSNRVRERLKGQDLSFTEIAKVVGERWQVVSTEEREECESQANSAKEKYYSRLAEYKKTPQYEAYQSYLEDFRAKHAAPTKEGKRSKLETETSNSSVNNAHDQTNRPENRRLSLATTESPAPNYPRSEQSPSVGSARLPAGSYVSSKPTSPAMHPISGYNSPRVVEYSPKSASPRPTTTPKEGTFDASATHLARDFRGQLDLYSTYPPTSFTASHHHHHPSSATAASHPYATNFTDHPSRRPIRDYGMLPPLSHEDTTLSSESGHSSYSLPPVGSGGQTLPIDTNKSSRVLPQPIPSIGAMPLQLDRPLPSVAPAPILPPPHDYRTQGSLAVLAKAGEIASSAEEKKID